MAELVAAWLANYAVHSTLLISAAWLISSLVRLEPATRDLAWRLALLGGLVTATGSVAGQLLVNRSASPQALPVSALEAAAEQMLFGLDRNRPGPPVRFRGRVAEATPRCLSAVRASISERRDWIGSVRDACGRRNLPWYSVAAFLWFLGALIGAALEARRRSHLHGLFESLGEPGPRVTEILARLTTESEVRVPRVGCSPLLSSPSVLPGNVLALPVRCADELPGDELRAAIAHELAHVARRDVAWLGFFRWVAAICWIQPLNWIAISRFQEAAEGVCDDWALSRTGEPVALARSISTVVQWSQVGGGVSVPVAMTGERGCGLTERVARILGDRTRRADPGWMLVVVLLTLSLPIAALPSLPVPERSHVELVVRMDRGVAPGDEVGPPAGVMERRVVITRLRGD